MKPNPKVKAVPVRVIADAWSTWKWKTAYGMCSILAESWADFDTERSARRHAREFWAAYGAKVRFVR